MGGVIGAMSSKFMIKAGMLLLLARLDMHPVQAILDPAEPVTTISAELAWRIGLLSKRSNEIQLSHKELLGIDHSELRLSSVQIASQPESAQITIGLDLLAQVSLLLDFEHNRLKVISKSNQGLFQKSPISQVTRNMVSTAATVSDRGCLKMSAKDYKGRPISIGVSDMSVVNNLTSNLIRVHISSTSLLVRQIDRANDRANARCDSDFVLTWSELTNRRVLLDLPHQRLWLS